MTKKNTNAARSTSKPSTDEGTLTADRADKLLKKPGGNFEKAIASAKRYPAVADFLRRAQKFVAQDGKVSDRTVEAPAKTKPALEVVAPKGKKTKPPVDAKALSKTAYKVLTAAAFPQELRAELATRLGVEVKKTHSVREIARNIAKAIATSGSMPSEIADRVKPPKQKTESGPRRIETIVACLRRKNGASVDEIAQALLEAFPTYSARHGGAKADVEGYKPFIRTAMGHLRAYRQFSEARAMEAAGETIERSDDGRYRIVKK